MTDPDIEPRRAEAFAQDVAQYVQTHRRWDEMTKPAAVREAILVVLTDPGAARTALAILTEQYGGDGES